MNNIYYDFDAFYIREEAAVELDSLAGLLKDNPQLIKIEIGSHTDSRGSYAYNEKLSQKRAESCVKYLLSKGIDATRLEAKGYGESELANRCHDGVECTEEQHQRNRRTTFKVLMENMEIVSQEPEKIVTDYAPESARGVVEVEDRETVEEMLKNYEDSMEKEKNDKLNLTEEKKKVEKDSNEFLDSFDAGNQPNEEPNELTEDEKELNEMNSFDENLRDVSEEEEEEVPVFGGEEEEEVPVFNQNDDGSIDFGDDFEEEEKEGGEEAGEMLDDLFEAGEDNSMNDLTKNNVEWDFVEEESTTQEIIIKENQEFSIECVISAKYKEKKEYLFVLTNEDTLIEQIVDKAMFKTFEEGDEVVFKNLENGFKIVKK